MLPLIKREIVEKKKVLTDEEFIEGGFLWPRVSRELWLLTLLAL